MAQKVKILCANCSNYVKPKRGRFCNTCISRKQRAKNPMLYAYRNLKTNANRRRKPFSITFEDFKEFCYETDYMAGKGRTATSYSVDCIKDELGYAKGNLQKLQVGDNSRKYHREKAKKKVVFDWSKQTGFTTVKLAIDQTIDGPF